MKNENGILEQQFRDLNTNVNSMKEAIENSFRNQREFESSLGDLRLKLENEIGRNAKELDTIKRYFNNQGIVIQLSNSKIFSKF